MIIFDKEMPIEGAIILDGRVDDEVAMLDEPIILGDTVFVPADQFRLATHGADGPAERIVMLSSFCGVGIAAPLSSRDARSIAQGLINMAEKVEASAKERADAALAAAAKKGGAA